MDSDDDYLDEYDYYNTDDEEDEEDGRSWMGGPSLGTYCGLRPSFLYPNNLTLPTPIYISRETADRNAKALVEEEEREKEKANKKRLKKKRQKDRRRQQKLLETQGEKPPTQEKTEGATKVTISSGTQTRLEAEPEEGTQEDSSVSGSEDGLDLGSTFVHRARKRMENKPKPERRERAAKEPSHERAPERSQERAQPPAPPPPQPPSVVKVNIIDSNKLQDSLELANLGNRLASGEKFAESLHCYTEAIKINPQEYRFLGNRSYVYERLGRYTEALADAMTALELEPLFLKGHFRRGKALKGLKRYEEAVAAFRQVLVFDVNHAEAALEIAQCQQQLEMLTCTRVKILNSAPLSPPALVTGATVPFLNNRVFVPSNVYKSKGDARKPAPAIITAAKSAPTSATLAAAISAPTTGATPAAAKSIATSAAPAAAKSGPTITTGATPAAANTTPAGAPQSKLYPVWVGNITNKITEDVLRSTFEPFGPVHSMRILYARTCAFINFSSKAAAEAAFCALQGMNILGTNLVLQLRNPEHSNLNVGGASRKAVK